MKKYLFVIVLAAVFAASALVLRVAFISSESVSIAENLEALMESESRPYFHEPVWVVAVWYHGETGEIDVNCCIGGKHECPMYDSTLPKV